MGRSPLAMAVAAGLSVLPATADCARAPATRARAAINQTRVRGILMQGRVPAKATWQTSAVKRIQFPGLDLIENLTGAAERGWLLVTLAEGCFPSIVARFCAAADEWTPSWSVHASIHGQVQVGGALPLLGGSGHMQCRMGGHQPTHHAPLPPLPLQLQLPHVALRAGQSVFFVWVAPVPYLLLTTVTTSANQVFFFFCNSL